MARGPRGLRVVFTATEPTHFGELFLVQRFLQRLGVRPALRLSTPHDLRANCHRPHLT